MPNVTAAFEANNPPSLTADTNKTTTHYVKESRRRYSANLEQNETSTQPPALEAVADSPKWIPMPVRYLMLLLAFTGFNCVYALRVNLSVAIVAMTNDTEPAPLGNTITHNNSATNYVIHNHQAASGQCPSPPTAFLLMHYDNSPAAPNAFELQRQTPNLERLDAVQQQFHWPEHVKSQVLAAFFYGYLLMQLPASYLADRFGAHRVFGLGVLATAVLTLLTPLAANVSPWALFALRFLEGVFEGVTFPAMHVFWSYWAPVPERSRLVGICYCGAQFGTIFAVPFAGILAARFGWPSIFYVFGGAGCVWAVFWFIFSAHRPSQSRWITRTECEYIETNTDRADQQVGGGDDNCARKKPPVPWMKFARSPAVYAVALSHFGINWGVYTYLTELPSYMNNVLKFNSTQNGLLSALPYVAMWSMQMTSSIVADKLRNWQRFRYSRKNTVIRRTNNAIALFIPAVIVCCIPAVGCNHMGAVAMLVLALGFAGVSSGGYQVNHVDIASEYSGALMGISNTLATIPGFVTPAVVAWTAGAGSVQTIASWTPFFYLSAAVFVFCGVVNCFCTSGERLPWMDAYITSSSSPMSQNRKRNKAEVTARGTSPLQGQLSTVTTVTDCDVKADTTDSGQHMTEKSEV